MEEQETRSKRRRRCKVQGSSKKLDFLTNTKQQVNRNSRSRVKLELDLILKEREREYKYEAPMKRLLSVVLLFVILSLTRVEIHANATSETYLAATDLATTGELPDDSSAPHYAPLMTTSDIDEHDQQVAATSEQQQAEASGSRTGRTLYACEEKQLEIKCQLNESIQIIRANFGRFSIQICNEHGQLEWKVNCMSLESFQIIKSSCQSKQSCELYASSSIFGDPCAGTQKYLEVNYKCLPARDASNLSTTEFVYPTSTQSYLPNARFPPAQTSQRPTKQQLPNVILTTAQSALDYTTNSELPPTRPILSPNYPATPPRWPPWMEGVSRFSQQPFSVSSSNNPVQTLSANKSTTLCPEIVLRQIRWPSTEPGSIAHMPCPGHALSGLPGEPLAASLICSPVGRWTGHVQAARCQSNWLRNLTLRLEKGDSPLSILAELLQRTRPASLPLGLSTLGAGWPPLSPMNAYNALPLFGDDLVQIGRVMRRLAEEMGDFLMRIGDEKLRSGFAKEIVQSLVELINNLAHEEQREAWLDLAPQRGERQRISSQLLQSLELASTEFAASIPSSVDLTVNGQPTTSASFERVTENAYLAIHPLAIREPNLNKSLEISFPSELSILGTRWMHDEQLFTLHLLQTPASSSNPEQQSGAASQVDVKYGSVTTNSEPANSSQQDIQQAAVQSLKVVFSMIRGLNKEMEPIALQGQGEQQSFVVNSHLVSISIVDVADLHKYTPIKVLLSAPVELVFRHLESIESGSRSASMGGKQRRSICAYWDTNSSDWQTQGCKLIASNRTHSSCACEHLTYFALLTEWDNQQSSAAHQQHHPLDALDDDASQNMINQQQQQQQRLNGYSKVQLDSVENEIYLLNKLLHLAKLLDGRLFEASESDNQLVGTNLKLLVYLSCLISAAVLALLLTASAYNQAHARRLLGSIPSEPPPPLLVSNHQILSGSTSAANHLQQQQHHQQQQQQLQQQNSSPSYASSSDYSAALAATKSKIIQRGILDQLGGNSLAPSSGQQSRVRQLAVPMRVLLQLLALELLLVLLVESENYMQPYRSTALASHRLNAGRSVFELSTGNSDSSWSLFGLIAWLEVLSLYYLIASITCWLISQFWSFLLISLAWAEAQRAEASQKFSGSGKLMMRSSASTSSAATTSDIKSIQYGSSPAVTSNGVSVLSAAAFYAPSNGARNPQVANVYAASSLYNQQQLHSSASPSSSFSSSIPDAQVQQESAASRLYGLSGRPGQPVVSSQANQAPCLASILLAGKLSGRAVEMILIHALPVILVAFLAWLTNGSADLLSEQVYTRNPLSQYANWPLLIYCTSASSSFLGISFIIYYLPTLCLLLALLVLIQLGKSQRASGSSANGNARSVVNPYGSSHNMLFSQPHLLMGQQQLQQQQQLAALSKQSSPNEQQPINAANREYWASGITPQAAIGVENGKRVKLLWLSLISLLALHSIGWICFFAHLTQSVVVGASGGQLMCAFAASNLLLTLLLASIQRRSLRRAAQLAGLTRLLGRACPRRVRGRSHSSAIYGSSSAGVNGVKGSPSSQSLFVISAQVAEQQQLQFPYTQPSCYSPNVGGSHLYQQLANQQQQQHIYDSANEQTMHRFSVQQQQIHQMHPLEASGFPGNGAGNLHRSLSSLQLQQQQQQQQLRAPMTLKARQLDLGPELVMLDGKQHCAAHLSQMQAQNQARTQVALGLSGEAEGPLVAFGSNNNQQAAPATFGPRSAFGQQQQLINSSAHPHPPPAYNQQPARFFPHQHQHQHQPATTEHPLFNTVGVQQSSSSQLAKRQASSPPSDRASSNCISGLNQQSLARCATSGQPDANQQHQCYSINGAQRQTHYTHALRAAMIEQQQQQQQTESGNAHHFRRSNSKQRHHSSGQPMIDRPDDVGGGCDAWTPQTSTSQANSSNSNSNNNIYDVANYTSLNQ